MGCLSACKSWRPRWRTSGCYRSHTPSNKPYPRSKAFLPSPHKPGNIARVAEVDTNEPQVRGECVREGRTMETRNLNFGWAAAFAALAIVGCGKKGEEAIASVNGEAITRKEY